MRHLKNPSSIAARVKPRWNPKINFGALLLVMGVALIASGGLLTFGQQKPTFESIQVGAFDPDAWNGVVFLAEAFHQSAPFALRFGSQRELKYLDGSDIFYMVSEVGPHAPDGSYCRMSWKQAPYSAQITLEWSRLNETRVIGRLTSSSFNRLVLETYIPFLVRRRPEGFYDVDVKHHAILGQRFFDQIFGPTA
jgi:hypothetical protein